MGGASISIVEQFRPPGLQMQSATYGPADHWINIMLLTAKSCRE